jgi:hypothetical protein
MTESIALGINGLSVAPNTHIKPEKASAGVQQNRATVSG